MDLLRVSHEPANLTRYYDFQASLALPGANGWECPKQGKGGSCGGRLRPTGQALLEHKGRRYDLLKTRCQACGNHAEFLFDINSSFGCR